MLREKKLLYMQNAAHPKGHQLIKMKLITFNYYALFPPCNLQHFD